MDYTTPDYTIIPNPKIYVPNDLPPSPRMKTVTIGKVEPGVWPEEYKHLDKGKPLIQELIDLEIKKHLGDDSWLDFSREAARRKYRFQPKKPGTIKHKPPERDEREVDLSVFIDVREEFGYDMREAIRFWSLHSMAHTRKRAEALTWYMKLQALLEGEELGKKNAALHEQRRQRAKKRAKPEEDSFLDSDWEDWVIEIDVNPEASKRPTIDTSAEATSPQPSTSGLSMGPGTRLRSMDSSTSDIGVSIGAVVDSEEDSP